jgi:hypothetical protein
MQLRRGKGLVAGLEMWPDRGAPPNVMSDCKATKVYTVTDFQSGFRVEARL